MNSTFRQKITQILRNSKNKDMYKNLANLIIQENIDVGKMLSIVQDEIEKNGQFRHLHTTQFMNNLQDTLASMITENIVKKLHRIQ